MMVTNPLLALLMIRKGLLVHGLSKLASGMALEMGQATAGLANPLKQSGSQYLLALYITRLTFD